jgi:hypothetical protein
MAVHKMQHAMMRAAESETRKPLVGVADEIAIGEKQKLDQIIGRPAGRALPLGVGWADGYRRDVYVSHIDISSFDCYRMPVPGEKIGPKPDRTGTIVAPRGKTRSHAQTYRDLAQVAKPD